MNKREFEKVFAAAAEKSGVAGMARDYQLAENLQSMMIDLRDKLYPTEQPSEDLKKEIVRILDAIKYGANWQKEQMMKSAIDATCVILPPPDLFKVLICHKVTDKLTDKQKIKILIIKEEEQ